MTPLCPLCGAGTACAFDKDGFRFRVCSTCGHLFLLLPTPEQEAEYYRRPEIHDHYVYHYYRAWHRRRARQDLAFIERFQPPGTVLDVGCSYGFFLEAARAADWKGVGLETAPLPADHARRQSGLEVHSAGIAQAPLEPGSFDLVCFLDSFEHHVAPAEALAAAARWLKRGGRIYLKLPNLRSLTYRLSGKEWSAIFGPGHPHYYSPANLRRLLEQSGYEIEHLATNSSEPHWQYFVIEAWLLRWRNRWRERGFGGLVALFDKLHGNLDVLAAAYFVTRPLYYLLWPLEWWLNARLLGHQIVAVARKSA